MVTPEHSRVQIPLSDYKLFCKRIRQGNGASNKVRRLVRLNTFFTCQELVKCLPVFVTGSRIVPTFVFVYGGYTRPCN